jgi:potassium efflux system protein
LENIVQELMAYVSVVVLRQIIALVIVLVVAWLLQFLLRRLLDAPGTRFAQIPWSYKFLGVVKRILWPLIARILGQLTIIIFQERQWEHPLLNWAILFINLWLLYFFFDALLRLNLSPERASAWSRKVLLPIILLVGLLQSIGVMDDVLQWSLIPRQDIKITVGSIVTGLAILAVFFVLSRGIRQYLERAFFPQLDVSPALTQALLTIATYAVVIIGAFAALSVIGVDLTTLSLVVGGLSVGLGFGLQEIVSNFVSGFILLFERSIGPGDVLKIGDTVGVVQNVGIRSMIIKTRDNVELIVPNSTFLTETVTNLTRTEDIVRIRIGVGVTYQADPREVEQALLEAAQHSQVLSDPAPTVQFSGFGDSSLNFDLLVWTNNAARIIPLASDIRYQIWEALKAHDIEIPFPQRDLHIRSGVPWDSLTTNS